MLSQLEVIAAGIGAGLICTVPVGPVNIITIHRALERGFWAGFAAGFGSLVADGLLALAATSGLTAISGFMSTNRTALQLVGGLVLLLFGLRLLLSSPHEDSIDPAKREADGWVIPKTFFLTITNPGAVLGMFAIVGSISATLGGIDSYATALLLVASIVAGGLLWWTALSAITARFAHHIDDRRLQLMNRFAGTALIAFGVYLVAEIVLRASALFA